MTILPNLREYGPILRAIGSGFRARAEPDGIGCYVARCGVRFADIDHGNPPPDMPPGLVVPILRIVKG